jgi:hypothetical protein
MSEKHNSSSDKLCSSIPHAPNNSVITVGTQQFLEFVHHASFKCTNVLKHKVSWIGSVSIIGNSAKGKVHFL